MSDQRDYGDEAEATTASAVAALRQHLPGVTQGEMGLTLPGEEQVPGDAIERLMAEVARLRVGLRHALWQVGQLAIERDRLRQQQREQLIQAKAEVERLQADLAAARQDVADLREAFAWVLSVANWPEWYYSPSVPEVVRRLTNIDEISGDRLDLRLLPEAERGVSGE